ncbi:MAG: FeoA family protein [Halanaerobacter sp.]
MENIMSSEFMATEENVIADTKDVQNLAQAERNREYIIKEIRTDDEELKQFLFRLGCYEGESITLISILAGNYVINVKDARYSIDKDLAEAIIV